eukprot:3707751-Rhodomonas_salina.2
MALASCPICLRACYAIPGTDTAYADRRARLVLTVFGTDIAYGLRACYAIPGTDSYELRPVPGTNIAYDTT